MCIDDGFKICNGSPFKTGYKVFGVKNGKLYTNFAGKEISQYTEIIEGKTTAEEKRRLKQYQAICNYNTNGVIFNKNHFDKISVYLDLANVIGRLNDKNHLVALVDILKEGKALVGSAFRVENIALVKKIKIRGFIKKVDKYGIFILYTPDEIKVILDRS